jgi:hypothetical protein
LPPQILTQRFDLDTEEWFNKRTSQPEQAAALQQMFPRQKSRQTVMAVAEATAMVQSQDPRMAQALALNLVIVSTATASLVKE